MEAYKAVKNIYFDTTLEMERKPALMVLSRTKIKLQKLELISRGGWPGIQSR